MARATREELPAEVPRIFWTPRPGIRVPVPSAVPQFLEQVGAWPAAARYSTSGTAAPSGAHARYMAGPDGQQAKLGLVNRPVSLRRSTMRNGLLPGSDRRDAEDSKQEMYVTVSEHPFLSYIHAFQLPEPQHFSDGNSLPSLVPLQRVVGFSNTPASAEIPTGNLLGWEHNQQPARLVQ